MESNHTLLQELNDRLRFLEIDKKKYIKNKILVDVIKECINNELFDEKLRNKIQNILIQGNLEQVSSIGNTPQPLLGVNLKRDQLDYGEKKLFEYVIVKALNRKFETICEEFYEISGDKLEDVPDSSAQLKLDKEDEYLLETRATMLSQRKLYLSNLKRQQELLEEIAELRTEKLQSASEEKIKQCEVETTMNLRKAEVLNCKIKTDIFMETPYSLNAYKTLAEDIKKQQEECREEIKCLENIKSKYSQVSCKQFDELLKTYKQYKSATEKKKNVCDNMNPL